MFLHQFGFLGRQFTRLVQDVERDAHFANVMQHGADAQYLQLFFRHAQVATHAQCQDTNTQAVLRGIRIAVFKLGKTGEGVRVADDALHNFADYLLRALGVEGSAETDVFHNLAGQDQGLIVCFTNQGNFLFQGGLVEVFVFTLPGFVRFRGLFQYFEFEFGAGLLGLFLLFIPLLFRGLWQDPGLLGIDIDVLAVAADFLELFRVGKLKALEQKWCLEPWAIKLGDIHADFQLSDI